MTPLSPVSSLFLRITPQIHISAAHTHTHTPNWKKKQLGLVVVFVQVPSHGCLIGDIHSCFFFFLEQLFWGMKKRKKQDGFFHPFSPSSSSFFTSAASTPCLITHLWRRHHWKLKESLDDTTFHVPSARRTKKTRKRSWTRRR